MTTQTGVHLQTSAAGARHHPQVHGLQTVHLPADRVHVPSMPGVVQQLFGPNSRAGQCTELFRLMHCRNCIAVLTSWPWHAYTQHPGHRQQQVALSYCFTPGCHAASWNIGYGPPPGALPPGAHLGAPPGAHLGAPPGAHLGAPPGAHPGAPPAANVISMALPHQARNALDNNDSVKTDGLTGLATVEYKLLVPVRRSGVILGSKGGVSGMHKHDHNLEAETYSSRAPLGPLHCCLQLCQG